ncbi:MAG: tRNA (adenosine(37)-N6)-threonylcarbamoyltransferase complex transferase subunit TsaD [Nitrospira sp. SB0666_bin_27]|nr:tRNA (adenosine(37)-N6)-threonylcarbamoyltransferase complex transferase subunit TsaD [Nitrospira sp. SB0666_bin_27]MYF24089.1 tRNA (adenosine(37)-N6)-threonylcarbamoyltransferase complex transferase subunit TsaD [Nitrospira sp. SB0678_bin_10]
MPRNGQTPTSAPSCVPTPSLLGIETSCDETAAAVFSLQGRLLSNLVASQHEVHGRFGGVVPELASRKHVERIEEITQAALNQAGVGWSDLRAIAVTQGPGLAGALVVGVSFGKALAYALGVPCIGVHHLEGHIASAWLEYPDFTTPCVVLVVSGGHTHLYLVPQRGEYRLLGKTLDDAAGEAFDKGAKMLGLSYPGGPALDRLAQTGDPSIVRFPRPYLNKGGFNFSFSGLKTSLLYYLRDRRSRQESFPSAHVAAGYQEAIVDVLVEKSFRAVRRHGVTGLAVVGGVSANSRLRTVLQARAEKEGLRLALPRMQFCTDNAAMVAAAGWWAYQEQRWSSRDLDAQPGLAIEATAPGNGSRVSV